MTDSPTPRSNKTDHSEPTRCPWCRHPLAIDYHDREWGTPCYDDRKLFEYLFLDAMQSGLSWNLMLIKRENFRRAFANFDPEAIARFANRDIDRLMGDATIIRNRRKIAAAIENARQFLAIQEENETFARYLWDFVDGNPIDDAWQHHEDIPTTSKLSGKLSRDLRQRGFRFVGSVTIYAYMEGAGLYNNHLLSCFRHSEVKRLGEALPY